MAEYEQRLRETANQYLTAAAVLNDAAKSLSAVKNRYDNAALTVAKLKDELEKCVGSNIPRRVFVFEDKTVTVQLSGGYTAVYVDHVCG